ncbi:recombinase family protein [Bdellovibrio sp. HCB337]|uniref:recombinase family protein n=1 Tax=Bdellovibrio sp. HCB337 TaxID=3394358 RepID=UPI0039A75455
MKSFNIGLYVRVSTEEQAENPEGSIKNQEARLREFVKLKQMVGAFGEVKEVFIDAGISAKDMNRPALQRLLNKIQQHEIDMILVTELSRFTRSIKDFSILKEFLEKHQCKFLSIKDNFDTSTAAGELVMYMMANIAEFERKQTAERISHSFLARAKRGLYNGGSVPMGYEIDKEKSGSLAIIPEEAEIVRMIFDTFLKEETLAKTAKHLNDKGITLPRQVRGGGPTRSSIFRIEQIHKVLRNKAYISVRVFSNKEGGECESRAVWSPIIDEVTFQRVQKLLTSNRYRKRTHLDQRYPFTLSGVCYCVVCGDRMSGKSAHGRSGKVPYYEHSWSTKNQASLSKKLLKCEPYRIQAAKIEPQVWQEVKSFLLSPEVAQRLLDAATRVLPENKAVTEVNRLKRKFQAITLQIETLTERISRLPKGMNEKPFFDQMMKLQDTQTAIEVQMLELEYQPQPDEVISFEDLSKFTTSLKALIRKADKAPEVQTEIIRKIVHRIEVHKSGCEIHFHIGDRHYKTEFQDKVLRPTADTKLIPLERFRPRTQLLPKFLKDSGSKRLTDGGGGGN